MRLGLAANTGSWCIASAVCDIPSFAPAQAQFGPKATLPNAPTKPTNTCRRVGPLVSAARFALSPISASPGAFNRDNSTAWKDVQVNILLALLQTSISRPADNR